MPPDIEITYQDYRGFTMVTNDLATDVWHGSMWIQTFYGGRNVSKHAAMAAINFHKSAKGCGA